MTAENSARTDTYDPRVAAIGFAAVFVLLLPQQALALASIQGILDDPVRMGALDWNHEVSVYLDRALHVGHLVGSVLGLFAAGMLFKSRGGAERIALAVVATPILLSTTSWIVWILTHLDDMTRHNGFGVLLGLLGLLCGLLCPPLSIGLVIAGRRRIRPRWGGALVCLCVAILVWTIATLVETIPIAWAL